MKKTIYLYLDSEYIGEVKVENVRMRETYMFQYAQEYVTPQRPIIDPSVANVRGPQFPAQGGIFGFLSDVAPLGPQAYTASGEARAVRKRLSSRGV